MRVIEKIEVSKLKYGCVVVTQNFLFNYSLFKIILNPSKKVGFSSENQKDMSVDGTFYVDSSGNCLAFVGFSFYILESFILL